MANDQNNPTKDEDIFQHHLKRICNIRWPGKITNQELWISAGQ